MKSTEEEPVPNAKQKKIFEIVFVAFFILILIGFISFAVWVISSSQKEENARINAIQESVQLSLTDEIYDLNDSDTPFHYILSYKLNNENKLFEEDMVYTYEFESLVPRNDLFAAMDTYFVKTFYKKVTIEGKTAYIPADKVEGLDRLSIVGTGLTKEDILKKHPNAFIIGEEFPKQGEWLIKGLDSIGEDYDLPEVVEDAIYDSFPFPTE